MKYGILYALLIVLGALLFNYTVNNIEVINWVAFDELLKAKSVTTQTAALGVFEDLAYAGQLLEYLRTPGILSIASSLLLMLFGFIGLIHMAIDKLFFRKFYQSPRLILALRRAVFWSLVPILGLYIWLLNYRNPGIYLLLILVSVGCEWLITNLLPHGKEEPDPREPTI